jgi:flagella basal body P-ring formation protein FlgA
LKLTRDAMSRRGAPQEDPNVVATVIAAQDIEPGRRLTATDLAAGKVSKDALPPGRSRRPATCSSAWR